MAACASFACCALGARSGRTRAEVAERAVVLASASWTKAPLAATSRRSARTRGQLGRRRRRSAIHALPPPLLAREVVRRRGDARLRVDALEQLERGQRRRARAAAAARRRNVRVTHRRASSRRSCSRPPRTCRGQAVDAVDRARAARNEPPPRSIGHRLGARERLPSPPAGGRTTPRGRRRAVPVLRLAARGTARGRAGRSPRLALEHALRRRRHLAGARQRSFARRRAAEARAGGARGRRARGRATSRRIVGVESCSSDPRVSGSSQTSRSRSASSTGRDAEAALEEVAERALGRRSRRVGETTGARTRAGRARGRPRARGRRTR